VPLWLTQQRVEKAEYCMFAINAVTGISDWIQKGEREKCTGSITSAFPLARA